MATSFLHYLLSVAPGRLFISKIWVSTYIYILHIPLYGICRSATIIKSFLPIPHSPTEWYDYQVYYTYRFWKPVRYAVLFSSLYLKLITLHFNWNIEVLQPYRYFFNSHPFIPTLHVDMYIISTDTKNHQCYIFAFKSHRLFFKFIRRKILFCIDSEFYVSLALPS